MNPKCEQYKVKMEKTIEVMKHEFNTIRAGRANVAVLDKITVDYYGAPTPIQQIASVSTPEPRMLAIQPWDASALKLIEKAILASDLGINPTNDGKIIRLLFPQLTEERRRDLTKEVKNMAEGGKVAIRNIRRDAIDHFKKAQKASEITEDELKSLEKDMQDLTDKYVKEVDVESGKKEKELMEL
ncbi:MAG: ribosome recycling factor [Clostridia bacterium]|nr:ribosome recycling factor [Clostridia bacterium]MBP3587810.1 ribosome recycling factor [Clostridia bacterium]MBQ4578434.1 ribosome recycling factor [Clostridia bacterium]